MPRPSGRLATATVASYHWTKRERNLLTIVAAVLAVQAVVHVTLGHAHSGRSMLGAHVASALLLALFLRVGAFDVLQQQVGDPLRLRGFVRQAHFIDLRRAFLVLSTLAAHPDG